MSLPDSITIEWHYSDIQEVDESLSDDQAREVLQLVKKYHDASVGISWETIEATIDFYNRKGF